MKKIKTGNLLKKFFISATIVALFIGLSALYVVYRIAEMSVM